MEFAAAQSAVATNTVTACPRERCLQAGCPVTVPTDCQHRHSQPGAEHSPRPLTCDGVCRQPPGEVFRASRQESVCRQPSWQCLLSWQCLSPEPPGKCLLLGAGFVAREGLAPRAMYAVREVFLARAFSVVSQVRWQPPHRQDRRCAQSVLKNCCISTSEHAQA